MDDSKIIELFFLRSEQAVTELSFKYGETCRKIALNILNNLEDAEECVNDTYMGTWNSIPPQKPNPLSTYVCKITRNIALKRYRYNTAKKEIVFTIYRFLNWKIVFLLLRRMQFPVRKKI